MCAYFVEDALIRAVVQELNGKVLCVALDLAYPWLADRRCYRHSRASKDTRAALYAACWPASMSVLSCNSKWMRVILICSDFEPRGRPANGLRFVRGFRLSCTRPRGGEGGESPRIAVHHHRCTGKVCGGWVG